MAGTLPAAIRSALSQKSDSFEILVLDDGSTDETERVLRDFARLPKVRILRHSARRGLTESRNRLLAEARGELISILDADDVLLPLKVLSHERQFGVSPKLGMVWGRSVIKDIVLGTVDALPKEGFHHEWDLIESYQAVHSATTWRREALIKAGGYDSTRTLVEDADMFLKVGDHFGQYYQSDLVAVKFRNSNNHFRDSSRDGERAALTRHLLSDTVYRRYGLTFPTQKQASVS